MSLARDDSGGGRDLVSHKPTDLAAFHKIVSEQLNARLSESPKFFAALVIVGSAYGYALWLAWDSSAKATEFLLASILAYAAVVWSLWYLAALGYAFRFLQNTQHCIEKALGWDQYAPSNNEPPCHIQTVPDMFWLLPGIYHAHTFGLVAFLVIIGSAFLVGYTPGTTRWVVGGGGLVAGLLFASGINIHYVRKFRGRRRRPEEIGRASGEDRGDGNVRKGHDMTLELALHQLPATDVRRGWVRIHESRRGEIESGSVIRICGRGRSLFRVVYGIPDEFISQKGDAAKEWICMDEPDREALGFKDVKIGSRVTVAVASCRGFFRWWMWLGYALTHPEIPFRLATWLALLLGGLSIAISGVQLALPYTWCAGAGG